MQASPQAQKANAPRRSDEPNLRLQSRESEKACIGSMLRNPKVILDVLEIVPDASDFSLFAHQRIFQAIKDVNAKRKASVDLVTVAAELHARNEMHEVGGEPYLCELWDDAPTTLGAPHYAEIVKQKARLRDLSYALIDIQKELEGDVQDPGAIIEAAERKIFAVNHAQQPMATVTVEAAMKDANERADVRAGGGGIAFGIETGFAQLDYFTNGLQPGEIYVIAGRTSVGKTAFAINLFRRMVLNRVRVMFYSLEQSTAELTDRLIAIDSLIDGKTIKRGKLTADEMTRFVDSTNRLADARSFINDSPTRSVVQMFAECRRLKARQGVQAVFIDYLQLIQPANRRDTRERQVAEISRELKLMARELGVAVVLLAQLNRNAESQRPKLSDLRESGAIEQDADAVIFLHDEGRNDQQQYAGERPDSDIEVILAKQRNGPTGQFFVKFIRRYTRFDDFES